MTLNGRGYFPRGTTKARYLAITEGDFPLRLGIPLKVEQIEADKEDPEIKRHFSRESAQYPISFGPSY